MNLITHFPYLLKYAIQTHIEPRLSYASQYANMEKRLIKTIVKAYEDVPFYREHFDNLHVDINKIKNVGDIKLLPFLTKEDIRTNYPKKLLARGVDLKNCYTSGTTGSTGKSINFAYSMQTYMFYLCTNLRVYTMIGYKPWYKVAYIKYTPISTLHIPVLPLFRTFHIPSIITLEEQMEMLRAAQPDMLIGYASIIMDIAQHLTKRDRKYIKPRLISVNSELSTAEERKFICDTFNCPVYDEYSTEETWMVASQCKYGSYHLFTDNVHMEFIDKTGADVPKGEIGEMVATTLRSPAMPLIRYKIGDLGVLSDKVCKCGRKSPILESFEGRADDAFILKNGEKITSLKLLNTFTKFIKSDPELMNEFKFIQKKVDYAIILLVPGSGYDNDRFNDLITQLKKILKLPFNIDVQFVKKIDNNGGIKRKAIESLVKRS